VLTERGRAGRRVDLDADAGARRGAIDDLSRSAERCDATYFGSALRLAAAGVVVMGTSGHVAAKIS
jgi:hypothetical protein